MHKFPVQPGSVPTVPVRFTAFLNMLQGPKGQGHGHGAWAFGPFIINRAAPSPPIPGIYKFRIPEFRSQAFFLVFPFSGQFLNNFGAEIGSGGV